jgi:hypothetical protein
MDEQFLTIKSAISALAMSYASTKKLNLMEQQAFKLSKLKDVMED